MNLSIMRTPKGCEFIGLRPMNLWIMRTPKGCEFAADYDDERAARFRDHLKRFAWEKHFEGVGLEVTEEMIVVLSGQAARLSHNLPDDVAHGVYDAVESVVLRPTSIKKDDARILGLVHRIGTMVLAWDAVKHGLAADEDGHDTAVHELAHVIDLGTGAFDGTPPMDDPRALRAFASVCAKHFLALQASVNLAASEAARPATMRTRSCGRTVPPTRLSSSRSPSRCSSKSRG